MAFCNRQEPGLGRAMEVLTSGAIFKGILKVSDIQTNIILMQYFYVFIFVLGLEPRALRMVDRCWTTELHPQAQMQYLKKKTNGGKKIHNGKKKSQIINKDKLLLFVFWAQLYLLLLSMEYPLNSLPTTGGIDNVTELTGSHKLYM